MVEKPAPKSLALHVRALGAGLPLAISEQGYREVLAATRVVRKGPLAGAFGPVALSAAVSTMNQGLDLSVQLAPLPNLEVFADQMGAAFALRVTSVKDTQGKELLDLTSSFVTDPVFETPKLEREPSVFAPDLSAQQTTVDAVLLPGSKAVSLHALRSVPLTRSVETAQLGRIEGRVDLALPAGAQAFQQRGPSWSLNHGPVAMEGKLDKGRSLRLTITKGADHLVAHVAKNRAGEVLESSSYSRGQGDQGKVAIDASYDDDVASVDVILAATIFRQSYPFVLTP